MIILCLYSSPAITNCSITSNSSRWDGGGIHGNSASPVITNCTISGNKATGRNGGGCSFLVNCNASFSNCIISGNKAYFDFPGEAGSGNFGLIQSGALEQSNVDLSAQLVNLIVAQQSYQANSQTISTENSIIQTILNIR